MLRRTFLHDEFRWSANHASFLGQLQSSSFCVCLTSWLQVAGGSWLIISTLCRTFLLAAISPMLCNMPCLWNVVHFLLVTQA